MQYITMDAFTAGMAFAVAQVCTAIVMYGVYLATRTETCTRYWALGNALTGAGILVIAVNAGAPNYLILAFGNDLLIAGLVVEWWGLQVFAGRRPSRLGHGIFVIFFVGFGALLSVRGDVAMRSAASALAVTTVFALCLHDLWLLVRRQGGSAASVIACAVSATLIITSLVRLGFALRGTPAYSPTLSGALPVTIVFLIPLACKQLFSLAQLLLYFERLVLIQQHKALHDELTGLMNRRALNAAGKRELSLALRQKQALAVAYIDVDFFKNINDNYGHRAGDEVLREVAAVLSQGTREVDHVARYGGDEFCVVLPGLSIEDACEMGDRLLAAMRSASPVGLTVSLSIGIATTEPGSDIDWEDLLQVADKALYASKQGGRNCCTALSALSRGRTAPSMAVVYSRA